MTRPAQLPLHGRMNFRETSKERLLKFWQDVVRKTGVEIRFQERVTGISPLAGGGFEIASTRGKYLSRAVLLAIGRRGTPRQLGVAGEDLAKVVYRLVDAEQYRGKKVAVIGGGDSALEAAVSLAGQSGTEVTLSYRRDVFDRVKLKNRERLESLAKSHKITLLMRSEVDTIEAKSIHLTQDGRRLTLANDAVIICAGGVLPTGFLKAIGIAVEMKHGTA